MDLTEGKASFLWLRGEFLWYKKEWGGREPFSEVVTGRSPMDVEVPQGPCSPFLGVLVVVFGGCNWVKLLNI